VISLLGPSLGGMAGNPEAADISIGGFIAEFLVAGWQRRYEKRTARMDVYTSFPD
jgi:hypothetical protein